MQATRCRSTSVALGHTHPTTAWVQRGGVGTEHAGSVQDTDDVRMGRSHLPREPFADGLPHRHGTVRLRHWKAVASRWCSAASPMMLATAPHDGSVCSCWARTAGRSRPLRCPSTARRYGSSVSNSPRPGTTPSPSNPDRTPSPSAAGAWLCASGKRFERSIVVRTVRRRPPPPPDPPPLARRPRRRRRAHTISVMDVELTLWPH